MNPKKRQKLMKKLRHERRQNKRTANKADKLAVLDEAYQLRHDMTRLINVQHLLTSIISSEQLKVHQRQTHLRIGSVEIPSLKQRHLLHRNKFSLSELNPMPDVKRRLVLNRPHLSINPIEISKVTERRSINRPHVDIKPLEINPENFSERSKLSNVKLQSFDVKMPEVSSQKQIEHININDFVSNDVVQLYQGQHKLLAYYPDWSANDPEIYEFPVPWTQADESFYDAYVLQSRTAVQMEAEQSTGQGMVKVLNAMGFDYDIIGRGMYNNSIWQYCMLNDYEELEPSERQTVQQVLVASAISNVQAMAKTVLSSIADYYHAQYGISDDNGKASPEV